MNVSSCLAKGTFAETAIGRSADPEPTRLLVRTFHPSAGENDGGFWGFPTARAGGGAADGEGVARGVV
jgi:hypothetical protein